MEGAFPTTLTSVRRLLSIRSVIIAVPGLNYHQMIRATAHPCRVLPVSVYHYHHFFPRAEASQAATFSGGGGRNNGMVVLDFFGREGGGGTVNDAGKVGGFFVVVVMGSMCNCAISRRTG